VSERIDFHSWDGLLLREIGGADAGKTRAELAAGLPPRVADEWLGDALSRGLVAWQGERVLLTGRGKAAYEALPADSNQVSIGLPAEQGGTSPGLLRRLRARFGK
jgi:hypothetical protein